MRRRSGSLVGVPRFEPFPALRYAVDDLTSVIAPPYDVLSEADVDELEMRSEYNVVHIDVPRERDGADRYVRAGERLRSWIDDGVLVRDPEPSLTLYRMSFDDAAGRARQIVGVLGALEVVDEGAHGVLPHERVTPKASTDRLDLTRATLTNMSPIWGLSLASGMTGLLVEPGEPIGSVRFDGVEHAVERVNDPHRIAAIRRAIGSDSVLIADGHHRYGVARRYRDEVRAATGSADTASELTLAFVSELVAEQLSVEAIHRVYRDIESDVLVDALRVGFEIEPAGPVSSASLAEMDVRGCLCLVDRERQGWWLIPRPNVLDDVRALDGVWLEHLLEGTSATVSYQHGVDELGTLLDTDPTVTAAVLIRPVSVQEIERTAREGLLMPPKSTFFTPKLRTGLVLRPLD
jgi:uncharacterized protein (DUF1015 family)